MKSIFLKLSSFRFGAARRHCPFTSIIHKLISFLFAVIFFSMHCFLVPAAATQIQPQFNPIIGSSAYQVQNFVAGLTPDQLQIFYLLSGTQAITYTGFGNYTVSEDLSTVDKVTNWLKEFGEHFYTDLFFGSVGLPSDLAAPLYDSLLGAADYSSDVNSSYADWVDSVTGSQDSVFVPFSKGLVPGYNQFFALNNGLFNWQSDVSPFVTDVQYKSGYMSDNVFTTYWNTLQTYPAPYVRLNYRTGTSYNFRLADNDFFLIYHNLFVNTDTHKIYISDNYGNLLNYSSRIIDIRVGNDSSGNLLTNTNFSISFDSEWSYNPSTYPYVIDAVRAYFNNVYNNGNVIFYSDFIDHVYSGSSWNNKIEIFNIDDFGFQQNNSQYVNQPLEDLLVDIKGLIQELVNAQSLQQPVYNNLYDLNGQPEPAPATQPLSISVQLPESGIVVPSGLFGSSKGFIDYLWYMTKPLVQYTHDFVGTMWFDGVDGFDFSGPAPIVFGVITLGLIGGLIVKFLL